MPQVFIPSVKNNSASVVESTGEENPCGMNDRAYEFSQAWLGLLGDRRKQMVCDSKLVRCAQAHAEFLSQRVDISPSMHIGQNGSTANQRVREAGYRLLKWHEDGNTVESDAHSWDSPAKAAVDLAYHDTHYDHMFGIGFYLFSTVYGVGNTKQYFVFLACPPEGL